MNHRLRVLFFPSLERMSGNPYWDSLASALRSFDITVQDMPGASFSLSWLWAQRSRYQVIHFHYIQQFYAYEAKHARLRWVLRFGRNLLAARAIGYRTVFTLHNLYPSFGLQPAWVDYLGHRAATNLTDRVIVHCQAAKQALAETYGRRRGVSVISHPNYIDNYPNQVARRAARVQLGLADEDFVYLFIGGIRPNKGVEKLVTAFRTLQGDKLRLVIAGKSDASWNYLAAISQSAKTDQRILIDDRYIPDAEIQVYLNACDVVVLPFARVLTSGSVILASSFGRPVIAPAIGCLPETLTADCGILYDPEDSTGLESALQNCQVWNLGELGAAARKSIESATWTQMALHTREVYLS